MAAKVYATPEGIDAPEFEDYMGETGRGFDGDAYFKACDEHRAAVAAWCREAATSTSELIGETITFPVADGRAEYMVYTTKPLALIHLPYVDAYEADPILLRGLRVADVERLVASRRNLAELFGHRSA